MIADHVRGILDAYADLESARRLWHEKRSALRIDLEHVVLLACVKEIAEQRLNDAIEVAVKHKAVVKPAP